MSFHTTTNKFTSVDKTSVTVILNGGTASIDVLVGGTYYPIETVTEDSSLTVEGRGIKFQVTVSGGAVYEVS